MPKRSGSSNSRGNNKRRAIAAVPTQPMLVPTGTGPQRDLRLIMERVFAQSKSTGNSNNNCYWNSGQEANFLRLCIQEPSLVTSMFIIHGIYVVPLTFMIKFRAKLSLLQVFCKKFPQALKIKSNGLYPFEIACAKPDVVPGTVPVLARSYPEAACKKLRPTLDDFLNQLKQDDDNHRSHNATILEKIKAVVESANTVLGFLDDEESQSLFFHLVINNGACHKQRDLMNFVVKHCPDIIDVKILAKQLPWPRFLGPNEYATPDISSRLLLVTPQLKELEIDIDLDKEDLGVWQNFMRAIGNSSHLQALKLWVMHWPEDAEEKELFASALFDALGNIPNLKGLFLRGCDDIRIRGKGADGDGGDLGEILASILRRNTIEKMFVLESEPEPKHEPILEALKENTSLECLGIDSCYDTEEKKKALLGLLTEKNTTLQDVIEFDDSPNSLMDQIAVLCFLNEFGRGMARDPLTPSAALVALVEEAVAVDIIYTAEDLEDMPDDGVGLDLIYGLLRECPSIWCG